MMHYGRKPDRNAEAAKARAVLDILGHRSCRLVSHDAPKPAESEGYEGFRGPFEGEDWELEAPLPNKSAFVPSVNGQARPPSAPLNARNSAEAPLQKTSAKSGEQRPPSSLGHSREGSNKQVHNSQGVAAALRGHEYEREFVANRRPPSAPPLGRELYNGQERRLSSAVHPPRQRPPSAPRSRRDSEGESDIASESLRSTPALYSRGPLTPAAARCRKLAQRR